MSEAKELKEKLFHKKKSAWLKASEEEKKEIFEYAKGYMDFLNHSKTEREIVESSKKIAEENGFRNIHEVEHLMPGDKVYFVNRDKSMYLAVMGRESIANGMNLIGAHGDSPRLDLKPNPFYEEDGIAYLKTHYYGGIKKYQWTAIPYSMHGVIVKTNGEKIKVNIGEKEEDPIFTISDLLIHLANKQMEKKLKDGITGEQLNLMVGNIPYNDEEIPDNVKLNILNLLFQKYGILESDFLSAEIELVPAFKAKSMGLDESMVAGYGQDDKICVYTSLTAMMKLENIEKTAVCIITDKEEIGSMGNTGMESQIFDVFVAEMMDKSDVQGYNRLENAYAKSRMLSADVDGAVDPNFSEAFEKNNNSKIGYGIGINKYTGGRGKSNASDANAEYVAEVRRIFEENGIPYQESELGKIDEGGGGTIALIFANKGIDIIDCGVPVLSMHSPYEVTSKVDVYYAYKAYQAFWRN